MKKNIFHSKSSMALTSLLFSLVLSLCFFSTLATFQRFQHPVNSDGSLNFLVVGDWGRRGTYNQSEVAQQMGRVGEELDINFVVSAGDNFYDDGLKGVNDSAFQDSFTNIYTAHGLQKQWYSILGNHDYRGDVEAQLDPILRKKDRRWLCLRSFVVNTKIADFFFVDTTPFVNHYITDPEDHTYDWRGVVPRKNYNNNLLKEVDSALKDSKSPWKIVVGHHGIRSVGHHGDTQELVDRLLPILLANNVDLYINGHDHCLQRISCCSKSSLQFLTSGGGSKAWNGDVKDENKGTVEFFYDGQGFMSVQLSQTHAQIAFYDVYGRVLHTYNASSSSNPLYSTV